MHVVCGYALKAVDFEQCHFQNGRLSLYLIYKRYFMAAGVSSEWGRSRTVYLTQAGHLFYFVNAHDVNLCNLFVDVDYVLSLFN